jgi:hypothetical protein
MNIREKTAAACRVNGFNSVMTVCKFVESSSLLPHFWLDAPDILITHTRAIFYFHHFMPSSATG